MTTIRISRDGDVASPTSAGRRGQLAGVLQTLAGLCSGLLFLALAGSPAAAQDRYIAFGDSITSGFGFDGACETDCGYPRRLRNRLSAAGLGVPVVNHGQGGERTPEGLTRLTELLSDINAGVGDVVLLMEGSNDISRPDLICPETTLFNLGEMGRQASLRGVETVHATLIPRYPDAVEDADNKVNVAMARSIRDLAFSEGRQLVDPFAVFFAQPNLFNTLYSDPDFFDPVGHPNGQGFSLLADAFFDVLTGRDNVPPVLGFAEPAPGSEGIGALARIRIRAYDFGDGIDASSARMFINGTPVAVDVSSGGQEWLDIVHQPVIPLPESVTVEVAVSDLATPVNVLETRASSFEVAPGGPDACTPGEQTLCIDHLPGDRRFRVTMSWSTAIGGGQSGQATATPLAPLGFAGGGLLSFFPGTPEVLIKVLDACGQNDRFWIFSAPTTTLGFELIVEDLVAKSQGAPASAYKFTARNSDGQTAVAFSDTDAFDTCSFNR